MAQWFGPKLFGYGVGPKSWQGWAASAVVLGIALGSRYVSPQDFGMAEWVKPAVLTAVILGYIVLASLTYEPD
jgi:hypothetical protein